MLRNLFLACILFAAPAVAGESMPWNVGDKAESFLMPIRAAYCDDVDSVKRVLSTKTPNENCRMVNPPVIMNVEVIEAYEFNDKVYYIAKMDVLVEGQSAAPGVVMYLRSELGTQYTVWRVEKRPDIDV